MRFIAILGLGAALTACSQWTYDLGQPLSREAIPATGTDLGAVIAQLGPPMRVSATTQGYVLAWEHWVVEEGALGISLGPVGADLLAIDLGRAEVSGEFLLLGFDRNHQLASASFSQWDDAAGQGIALQPSFGLVNVVDVSDLIKPMPVHLWGALGLQQLPQSLNSRSPDSGQDGLEQRGTPQGAGQRTLEYRD